MREALLRRENSRRHRRVVGLGTGYKRRRLGGMPSRVVLPPERTFKEKYLRDAHNAACVELLMLKGVTNRALIQRLLNINDKRKVYRYVKMVHARWEAEALIDPETFFLRRGQLICMVETLLNEAWKCYERASDAGTAVKLLRLIVTVNDSLSRLYGLTPRVIDQLSNNAKMPGYLKARFEKQDLMVGLAVQLSQIIKKNREEKAADSRPRRHPFNPAYPGRPPRLTQCRGGTKPQARLAPGGQTG
jgi:hypothetical protein